MLGRTSFVDFVAGGADNLDSMLRSLPALLICLYSPTFLDYSLLFAAPDSANIAHPGTIFSAGRTSLSAPTFYNFYLDILSEFFDFFPKLGGLLLNSVNRSDASVGHGQWGKLFMMDEDLGVGG